VNSGPDRRPIRGEVLVEMARLKGLSDDGRLVWFTLL